MMRVDIPKPSIGSKIRNKDLLWNDRPTSKQYKVTWYILESSRMTSWILDQPITIVEVPSIYTTAKANANDDVVRKRLNNLKWTKPCERWSKTVHMFLKQMKGRLFRKCFQVGKQPLILACKRRIVWKGQILATNAGSSDTQCSLCGPKALGKLWQVYMTQLGLSEDFTPPGSPMRFLDFETISHDHLIAKLLHMKRDMSGRFQEYTSQVPEEYFALHSASLQPCHA